MGWLCLFFACRWRWIAGRVWQCDRCKTCSQGRDLDMPG